MAGSRTFPNAVACSIPTVVAVGFLLRGGVFASHVALIAVVFTLLAYRGASAVDRICSAALAGEPLPAFGYGRMLLSMMLTIAFLTRFGGAATLLGVSVLSLGGFVVAILAMIHSQSLAYAEADT